MLSYGNKLLLFHLCISFIFNVFALFFDASLLQLQNDFFQKLSLDFIRPPVVKDDIFLHESDNKVLNVDLPLLSIMESSYFKKKIIHRVIRHKSYLILFMSRIFYVTKRYNSLHMLVSHNIFFFKSTLKKYWNSIVQALYIIPFFISYYNIVNNSREIL